MSNIDQPNKPNGSQMTRRELIELLEPVVEGINSSLSTKPLQLPLRSNSCLTGEHEEAIRAEMEEHESKRRGQAPAPFIKPNFLDSIAREPKHFEYKGRQKKAQLLASLVSCVRGTLHKLKRLRTK